MKGDLKMDNETTVTPVEEAVVPTEEATEQDSQQTGDSPQEETQGDETAPEVDYQQKYTELEKEVKQMKAYIRSRQEEDEETGTKDKYEVPKSAQDFLSQFAEDPHGTVEKLVNNKLSSHNKALLEVQQQQAIDYVQAQKDFTPEMFDELLYVIEGPERNNWFNFGNQQVQLKNLPPRQKAEAALQIWRASKSQAKTNKQATNAPKPNTTIKTKATGKTNEKADEVLSAEEFAKKYGIKNGAL